jgi:hypothetical protein
MFTANPARTSDAIPTRTLSWVAFAMVACLVAFWTVYFPLERAQLRPLAESIHATLPVTCQYFLGGAWWSIPLTALLLGVLALLVQVHAPSRVVSTCFHLATSMLLLVGIVVYREAMLSWCVELVRNL